MDIEIIMKAIIWVASLLAIAFGIASAVMFCYLKNHK